MAKTPKEENIKVKKDSKVNWYGIAMLLVVASISFMAVFIWLLVDEIVVKAFTLPAAAFIIVQLLDKFGK